jgi:hypothetical protein
VTVHENYPLLDVRVSTPTLELRSATDELLDQLADVVRAGKTYASPAPYDDPMSFYETDPELRVARWLRAIWRRRGTVEPDAWRLRQPGQAVRKSPNRNPNHDGQPSSAQPDLRREGHQRDAPARTATQGENFVSTITAQTDTDRCDAQPAGRLP